MLDIDHAVISDFRTVEHVVTLGIIAPGKLSAVDNHSTKRCAVSSHEFRHGMHNNIGTIFNGSQEDGRGNRIVDN